MNKKEKMYQEIEHHGSNLNKIFDTKFDNIALSKKIFAIERKAHQLALDYCNGENGITTDNWEDLSDKILLSLDKILQFKAKKIPVYLNGDARGYALKIQSEYANNINIYRDWGGYGILAPDFS